MTKTVAQTYTEKLEAAYNTFETLPDMSGCPGWGETATIRAANNRRAFTSYVAHDVFQAAADRAQAAGVDLPADQMAIMEAAAIRIVGRDAAWWTNRSKDWGKLLMDEVRS